MLSEVEQCAGLRGLVAQLALERLQVQHPLTIDIAPVGLHCETHRRGVAAAMLGVEPAVLRDHHLREDRFDGVAADDVAPDVRLVLLVRRQFLGHGFKHDAVEGARLAELQRPRLYVDADLAAFAIVDADLRIELGSQPVQQRLLVLLETVVEPVFQPLRLPAEQRLVDAEQFAGIGSDGRVVDELLQSLV